MRSSSDTPRYSRRLSNRYTGTEYSWCSQLPLEPPIAYRTTGYYAVGRLMVEIRPQAEKDKILIPIICLYFFSLFYETCRVRYFIYYKYI